jgi:hypothetical protein
MNPQKNKLIQKFANVILKKKRGRKYTPILRLCGELGVPSRAEGTGRCSICTVAEDGTLTPAGKPVPAPLPANITIAAGKVRSTLCKNRIDA